MDDNGKPELTFSFDAGKLGLPELREVLELPEKLVGRDQQLVIVLDEFQEVADLGLGMNFEKIMRSVIENHTDIGYVFLGSKTHMLKRMFATPARPFYRSAQSFCLELPPEGESADFLIRQFKSVKIDLSRILAADMVVRSGNVPYYLQALGSWTFRAVQEREGRSVTREDVDQAYEQMFAAERDLFENLFRGLPESQRLVARALAREPVAKLTEEYRLRHFLPSLATSHTALRRLVADSRADMSKDGYHIVDPLFAHYLAL